MRTDLNWKMLQKTLYSICSSSGLTVSTGVTANLKASIISIDFDLSGLLETDPESICAFLRKFNRYSNLATLRARKPGVDMVSIEPFWPVDWNVHVNMEFFESTIALNSISDMKTMPS